MDVPIAEREPKDSSLHAGLRLAGIPTFKEKGVLLSTVVKI